MKKVAKKITGYYSQRGLKIGLFFLLFSMSTILFAQKRIPVITSNSDKAWIAEGKSIAVEWHLEPDTKPDIYYVNIPAKRSIVHFKTDKARLTIHTRPGEIYDFIVLLREKDSCRVRISSTLPPDLPKFEASQAFPISIPFRPVGSKIYFDGKVNNKNVVIQFDSGAGTGAVNKNSSEKLNLQFSSHKLVSNTEGLNKEKESAHNLLALGNIEWKDASLTEVGNMQDFEDIIIGNGFFRNYIIEIDYDSSKFIVHKTLPGKIKDYKKIDIIYEQNRPKFKAGFVHNKTKYEHWFLFDTGRDGTMLIGEDFTASDRHWERLEPLAVVNGRKIIRLNAFIAGTEFKDIVTNAADPAKPNGRPSLFGNQILNHFNVVLDNKNGTLYLKPNSLMQKPYFNYESYLKEVSIKK